MSQFVRQNRQVKEEQHEKDGKRKGPRVGMQGVEKGVLFVYRTRLLLSNWVISSP